LKVDVDDEMRALAELGVAGWPLGLTLAAAVVGDRVREARRRAALNRNLHELRRPLQALALAPASSGKTPAPAAAELALAALDDLDREINGSARPLALRPVACRALVESAVERWRGHAAEACRSLELRWRAGAAMAMADPCRVAQALDNLLANAIEHGGLRIWVDATIGARAVRISVSNTGRRGSDRGEGRARRDSRRGHGLRVVASIAAAHGGRFLVRQPAGGWAAILELPLADSPVSVAKTALAGSATRTEEHLAGAA
jgi:histidine kinase/DNA gyrase B/HSP90-like ATPase